RAWSSDVKHLRRCQARAKPIPSGPPLRVAFAQVRGCVLVRSRVSNRPGETCIYDRLWRKRKPQQVPCLPHPLFFLSSSSPHCADAISPPTFLPPRESATPPPMTQPAATAPHADPFFTATLAEADPDVARAIDNELRRQRDEIELIASENIVSRAVLEAQ